MISLLLWRKEEVLPSHPRVALRHGDLIRGRVLWNRTIVRSGAIDVNCSLVVGRVGRIHNTRRGTKLFKIGFMLKYWCRPIYPASLVRRDSGIHVLLTFVKC